MIGSYGPNPEAYEKKFQTEEAPSGMLARGHYEAKVKTLILLLCYKKACYVNYCINPCFRIVQSKFIDDDNVTHMEWTWSFDIKKDW